MKLSESDDSSEGKELSHRKIELKEKSTNQSHSEEKKSTEK